MIRKITAEQEKSRRSTALHEEEKIQAANVRRTEVRTAAEIRRKRDRGGKSWVLQTSGQRPFEDTRQYRCRNRLDFQWIFQHR